MKLSFLATGDAPTAYSFDGDQITAEKDGVSEQFDLSVLAQGDRFQGVEVDSLPLASGHIIRNAHRDEASELHVTLCQAVGPNDWTEQDGEIDAADYDPQQCYVRLTGIRVKGENPKDYHPVWSGQRGEWVAEKNHG